MTDWSPLSTNQRSSKPVNLPPSVILLAVLAMAVGIVIGWQLGARRMKSLLRASLAERNRSSLEVLETRKHVRTLSQHVKASLPAKKELSRLQQALASSRDKINQQKRYLDAQEKVHFIESADLKLALIEARTSLSDVNRRRPAKPLRQASNVAELCELQDVHPRIRANLKTAGIRELAQLAALNNSEIESLSHGIALVPVK